MGKWIHPAVFGIAALSLTTIGHRAERKPFEAAGFVSLQSAAPGNAETGKNRKVVYRNECYGFTFTLPASWKGFSVIERDWQGAPGPGTNARKHPIFVIRHPLYTEASPREDIPIMVFTRKEWRDVVSGGTTVSAAPFPPSEIGRNREYVFATPPRFINDSLEGWEEVVTIVGNHPLHPIAPKGKTCATGDRLE